MTYSNAASAGAFAIGLLCAAPALADVTAQQVWEAWRGLAEGAGQTVTGTETRAGDSLTVSDLTLSAVMEDGTAATIGMGDMVFTEQGDGTVAITVAPAYPVQIATVAAEGERVEMAMTIRQDDLALVASGTPAAISYEFSAPRIAVGLDRLEVDATPVEADFDMVMEDATGRYLVEDTSPRRFDSLFDARTVRLTASGADPDEGTRFALAMATSGVSSSSKGTVPDTAVSAELPQMLAAGFDVQGRLAHTGMDYTMQVTEAGAPPTTIAARAAAGGLGFALGAGGMDYSADSTDTEIVISSPEIPFPELTVAMEETAFRLQMPLTRTEAPTDFAFLTRLGGLSVSEQIWMMLDPAGQLPRDPATLVLDLAGKARWLVDITDPEAMAGDAAPGELHALTVKDLRLGLAGAELIGAGDFVFDNNDLQTFDGMPRPEGSMALRLEGGNRLLDTLVNMGLVPADQATGMRMMLGMFARPGAGGGDTLVSEITVTGDGQVLANGQRLR